MMGSEQPAGTPVPRGVEVLINKAAVDSGFKRLLLSDRQGAARAIGLVLEPSEEMILNAIPDGQLEAIINRTVVPEQYRPAFLGSVAKAMLVAITAMALAGCPVPVTGIAPDRPTPTPTKPTEDPDPDGKPTDANKSPEQEKNKVSSPKGGSRPDRPMSRGIQPDRPQPTPEVEEKGIE